MKIKKLLFEKKHDITKNQMQKWFNECMRKFFNQYIDEGWSSPSFEVKTDKNRAGWYKCSFKGNEVINPIIGLNSDFIEHTARNIIFHETIHYVQSNVYTYHQYKYASNSGHDAFFIEYMNKINAVEGKDFVTVKQDTKDLDTVSGGKNFWVYAIKTHGNEFGFAYSITERPNVLDYLKKQKKLNKYKQIYVFPSNKFKYKIGLITKTSIKFRIPSDQTNMEKEISQYEVF